jgi:beta-N-acetylhexosaminidase
MKALSGSVGESSTAVLAAGCDLVLHCNGVMAEMEQVAAACPALKGVALKRITKALTILQQVEPFEQQLAEAAIARVLSVTA